MNPAGYRAFAGDEPARGVKDSGLDIIGCRLLRDLIRQQPRCPFRRPPGRERRPAGGG
jgi:hypothetical protein